MSPRRPGSSRDQRPLAPANADGASRRVPLNGALAVSLVALAAAAVFVFAAMATVLGSAFGAGTGQAKPSEAIAELVAQHQAKMQTYQDRFNGRSPFFDPPAPPQKRELERKPIVEAPKPVEAPKAPDRYTGPNIIFAIGPIVRFKPFTVNDKPIDIHVGEQVGDLRVISTKLPWLVRVEYKGGEYDVPIFARGVDRFLLDQAPPVTLVPGLLEVSAPKPVIEPPTATGIAAAAPEADEADDAQSPRQTFAEKRAKAAQDARAASGRGGPQAPKPNQPAPKPASAGNADDETDDDEAAEEAGEDDEGDDEDEEAEPESGQSGGAEGQGTGTAPRPPAAAPGASSERQGPQRPQPRPR